MSAVKIQWTQRTSGRYPGDQEEVELTTFVQGCLTQGRCFIVPAAIVGFSMPDVDEPVEEEHDQPTGD